MKMGGAFKERRVLHLLGNSHNLYAATHKCLSSDAAGHVYALLWGSTVAEPMKFKMTAFSIDY